MTLFRTFYSSPIGLIEITGTDAGIASVGFVDTAALPDASLPASVEACAGQLDAYFRGQRQAFSLDLLPAGTAFQKSVWRALTEIPFGQVAAYKDVAEAVGRPKAFRAVGQANHCNPIAIIIPCHRVIGSNGAMTGYGSGIWRKEWLLAHEAKHSGAGDSAP